MTHTAGNIRRLRKLRGWNQTQLAERLGVSQFAVSVWERGGGLEYANLIAVADLFGVTLDELTRTEITADEAQSVHSAGIAPE